MVLRFRHPDGLVHIVAEAWDIIGERINPEYALQKAVANAQGTLPLNLRLACLDRGLWLQDPSNGEPTHDPPTCLRCITWRRP